MNIVCTAFAALFLLVPFGAFSQDRTPALTITDSKAIAHATALSQAIDNMGLKVSQCINEKLAPQEFCFCKYQPELNSIKEKYEVAIRNHPDWKSRAIFWAENKGHTSTGHNLVMPVIYQQLQVKCPN